MKTKLLLFFFLFSTFLFSQTTHNLDWGMTSTNQQITIDIGDTVVWTWGAGTHNLRSTSGVEAFDSGYGSSGFTFSHTFTSAGQTSYVCDPHPNSMYGTVTVNDSSASSGDYENFTFSIYPNPSSDYVKITLPQLNETANIQVFNMLGKMNFSDTSDDLNNYKLDVSNYRSGVYFVTISTMNIRVSNKFIKL